MQMTPFKELEAIFKLMKLHNISSLEYDGLKVTMFATPSAPLEKSKPTISKIEKMKELMPTEEELLYGSTRAPDLMAAFKDPKGKLNGS